MKPCDYAEYASALDKDFMLWLNEWARTCNVELYAQPEQRVNEDGGSMNIPQESNESR